MFRPRNSDPLHDQEKGTTIDRCDVAIVDEPGKNSRFIARIVFRNGMPPFLRSARASRVNCRLGITTKYKLPYEAVPPVRAKFDSEQAINHWSISSRTLRQLMDHFGPGIEYLDIHSDDDQFVNLTCFTEKVVRGDGKR